MWPAAGNNNQNQAFYPAGYSSVIQVGATCCFNNNYNDSGYGARDEVRIWAANGFGWGSNYGTKQELMGFGEDYIAPYGGSNTAYWDDGKTFQYFFNGTSAATPCVAGAFALLKTFFPTEPNTWLRDRMDQTADDLYAPGRDIDSGYGRVDVIRAIYGADRYAAEEDSNGFVDIAPHSNQVFDSLNAASTGDFIDTQDLYKYTVTQDGVLIVDLDIYSWGENLDLAVYDDPSMTDDHLLSSSTSANHYNRSHESVGIPCTVGKTFYIKVYTAATGDSSAYGLSAKVQGNNITINAVTSNTGFVHQNESGVAVGYIDFTAGYDAHLNGLNLSVTGTTPLDKITGIHLYRDTNGNNVFDAGDKLVANGDFKNTNRAVFSGFSEEATFATSPVRFFIVVDIGAVTGDTTFDLILTSYKDISTSEGLIVSYKMFPIALGPWEVGVDTDPPTWDTTVGIQAIQPFYESAELEWNTATDAKTPPVSYNVYWTQSLPFNFATANHSSAVAFASGAPDYGCQWKLTGLVNGQLYYVAVRTEDQAGNEDTNATYLSVTPAAIADPTAPQIIGSVGTPGDAWNIKVDPADQEGFCG